MSFPIICDWCLNETKQVTPGKFVVVTGRIDTMKIKEFFICDNHAEVLCTNFTGRRGMMGGTTFDIWQMDSITEHAHEFYNQRAARRIAEAAKRTVKARNLSYTQPKSDRWSLQRGGGIYWHPREIRKSLSFHGVCVGDGATLWNRSYKGT